MLQIGSVLDGKYKILSEIGRGGMSVVYMALNEKANKTWAVKEIRKDGKVDNNTVKQGLVAEIETLKQLKYEHLPSVVDIIDDDDSYIIVMDYIEGNSLDKALEEHGAQPQEQVVKWAKQLADVLGYLHTREIPIIYRDMKPANVMLQPNGDVTLIDFGTAKSYDVAVGETTGIGTRGYAAPEQYIGSGLGRSDARTDIYCLGMTLYHLLTGIDPCRNVISNRSVRAVNPNISQGLDEIIIRCTEIEPDNRYQSCEELLYDLEHHNDMGEKYRKKQRRKLITFATTSVIAIALGIASVWANAQANSKLEQNYDVNVLKAQNAELTESERLEYYTKALQIDSTKKDIYIEILDMMFDESIDDNAGEFVIDSDEYRFLDSLSSGLDVKGKDNEAFTMYPLDSLKEANEEYYSEVCYTIGIKVWDYYYNENDRHTTAKRWFDKVTSNNEPYLYSKYYSSIGECENKINQNQNNTRVDELKKLYDDLLQIVQKLYEKSSTLETASDTRRFVLKEICSTIYLNSEFILYSDKDTIVKLLEDIHKELDAEKDNSNKLIADDINNILLQNEKALDKINNSEQGE